VTPNTLVVVASERQVERLGRRGERAITRERLRGHLFEVAARDRLVASPIATRLVLADVLARAVPREPLLLSSAREGGEAWGRTVDAIDASIAAIRRAATSDEALARVAQAERGAVGARARLLRDLLRALDAALDARGLVDPRAVGVRLARAIAAAPSARIREAVGGSAVVARFVYGWDGDDAAWWRALDEALGEDGGSARVELPTFDADARLDAQRQSNPLDVVTDDVARALDAPPTTSAIAAVLGDLRLEGPLPPHAMSRISLCEASDADGQARAVMHAIREAMASGAAVDAMAVGAGALGDAALSAIRLAFEAARAPLEVVGGDVRAGSRMVAFAIRALGVGERGLARLEVASVLRSSYVDARSLGTSPGALLDLARALERTPTASASDARTALAETARASSEDAAIAAARAELALRVADVLLLAARPAGRGAHAASARRLFGALGLQVAANGAAERLLSSDRDGTLGASPEMRAVARDARGWAALDAGLRELERTARQLDIDGSTIPPLAFRHELAFAVGASSDLGAAPAAAAAVVIATLEELAGEELDLLVVIDANEGVLPSGGDTEESLAESIAPALRRIEPARAPASYATRSARSLAALAAAASGARRVVFVRRARDEEGAAVAPSPVFAWLERGGVPAVAWRASPLDGLATSAREAELRRAAWEDAGDAARRARIERARESRFEWTTAPRDPVLGDLDLVSDLDPRLLKALDTETGGGERPLAVTSLERFASCPFQGFATQVLRARKTRPLREVPDARESGTLLHRALAAAFRETAAAWRERPRDAARIRKEALAACDGVLREESVASSLRRLAVARIREAVVATLEWSLADEAWDFAYAERAFGEPRGRDGGWPPLVLVDGDTRLALGGSIDRVDAGHGRSAVRAIDYKLSRSAAERAMRGLGETAFQVALYAHAAADALGATERAGAYLAAGRPDAVGPKLKKDYESRWGALHAGGASLTPLETQAVAVVRRVRLGAIAPRPFDESTCANCDSSGACRKPRFAVARDDDGAA
jgi:RecB family exonuclease